MPAGSDGKSRAVTPSAERPLRSLERTLALGLLFAALVFGAQLLYGLYVRAMPIAYVFIGVSIAVIGWGAGRLWQSVVSPMFDRPFSIPAYVSRIPFWYMAAGIAYTFGILAANKFGWLTLHESPVREAFDFGAKLGCFVFAAEEFALERAWRGRTVRS